MLKNSLQIFEVDSRMRFKVDDITINGYNKDMLINFGLIILELDDTPCNVDDFIFIGSLPEDITYVKSIVVKRHNSTLKLTVIGDIREYNITIVPKGSRLLDVELFFRTPTFIANNNIKIKGGM